MWLLPDTCASVSGADDAMMRALQTQMSQLPRCPSARLSMRVLYSDAQAGAALALSRAQLAPSSLPPQRPPQPAASPCAARLRPRASPRATRAQPRLRLEAGADRSRLCRCGAFVHVISRAQRVRTWLARTGIAGSCPAACWRTRRTTSSRWPSSHRRPRRRMHTDRLRARRGGRRLPRRLRR